MFYVLRLAACAFIFVALLTAGSCASAPRDVRFATVDGHRVAYRVLGSGRPVVVMIAGLGDGMASFRDVAPDLAAHATVILYDRSGYGGSAMAAGPRDAVAADRELSGLLMQTGVAGPYVLLGHSLGGLFAEYYAAHHPDEISGLILEESRPADFTRRCQAARIEEACVATVAMMQFSPKGAQSEVAALATTAAQVETIGPVRGKPVLVMSRPSGVGAFDALWAQDQIDLTAHYSDARHVIARESGHYLHHDQKAWFVASVQEFLLPRRIAQR